MNVEKYAAEINDYHAHDNVPIGQTLTIAGDRFSDSTPTGVIIDRLMELGRHREVDLLRSGKDKWAVAARGSKRDNRIVRPYRPRDLGHIAPVQGRSGHGFVFGFDHARNNFINWQIDDGGYLRVHSIEPDETDPDASVDPHLTERDANELARRENRVEREAKRKGDEYGGSRVIEDVRRTSRGE